MHTVADLAKHIVPFKSQDDTAITQDITVSVARTHTLVVRDDATLQQAGEYLKGYADLAKRIEGWFADDIAKAFSLHRSLTTKRKQALDAIQIEVARLKGSLGANVTAQEADRRRREVEAQAEAQRLEDERIAREAAMLESAGQPELAAAVLDEHLAAPAAVVVLPSTTPRVAGVSTVERYEYRVINEALVPRELCSPTRRNSGAGRCPEGRNADSGRRGVASGSGSGESVTTDVARRGWVARRGEARLGAPWLGTVRHGIGGAGWGTALAW